MQSIQEAEQNIMTNTDLSNQTFYNLYQNLHGHENSFFACAVEYGNLHVAQSMYNQGASVNGPNDIFDPYQNPFALAIRSGNHIIIRWMLSLPGLYIHVLIRVEGDPSGIEYAIRHGFQYDVIESMVRLGATLADQEGVPNTDWMPLTAAVQVNNYRVIQLLLFYGADPHNLDQDGQNVASFAHTQPARTALQGWSNEATQVLRQMIGNNTNRLFENTGLWILAQHHVRRHRANPINTIEADFQRFNMN